MAYVLKPTTDADYEFIYQLNKLTMKALVEKTYGSWDEDFQRNYFRDYFSLINNFIITENDSYIGNFAFEETKDTLFIKNIQLLPQSQGKGIGSQILQDTLRSSIQKRQSVELRVNKLNEKAKKLYEKLGFMVADETNTHFLMRYSPIRSEKPGDAALISTILNDAFSPGTLESQLVEQLRRNPLYNPELSLIAYEDAKAVGYVLFFPLVIETSNKTIPTLALSPLGVIHEYQGKGYGSSLVREGLQKGKELGYPSVFVVGDTNFYGKFGFKSTAIQSSLSDYGKHFMSLELHENALKDAAGVLRYTPEFDIVR